MLHSSRFLGLFDLRLRPRELTIDVFGLVSNMKAALLATSPSHSVLFS